MATPNLNKTFSNTSSANAPADADKWAVTRAARRLASSPVSLYLWLSGPPSTQLERRRADLAYVEGARFHKGLVV